MRSIMSQAQVGLEEVHEAETFPRQTELRLNFHCFAAGAAAAAKIVQIILRCRVRDFTNT